MRKAPIGIAIVGAVLLVVGIIMTPLPGPGIPIAALGFVLLVVWTLVVIAAKTSQRRSEA